tara:strand:- start:378 stop:563 length:186 start_codon:yes stop_codon:yes gene_type:complete
MTKKGELTLRFMILLILALMVLIVVAIIFQDQIAGFVDTLSGTSSTLGTELGQATEGLALE